MKEFEHPAHFIMLLAAAIAICLLWVSCTRAEEPVMQDTVSSPTITQWIMQQNPACNEGDKLFDDKYAKLLTNYMTTGECKRYRPWKCRTTGYWGVDIEDLPKEFCQ